MSTKNIELGLKAFFTRSRLAGLMCPEMRLMVAGFMDEKSWP